MKLVSMFKTFRDEESGAVTVDWVVLTAAIVGIAVLVLGNLGGSVNTAATTTGASVGSAAQDVADDIAGL